MRPRAAPCGPADSAVARSLLTMARPLLTMAQVRWHGVAKVAAALRAQAPSTNPDYPHCYTTRHPLITLHPRMTLHPLITLRYPLLPQASTNPDYPHWHAAFIGLSWEAVLAWR